MAARLLNSGVNLRLNAMIGFTPFEPEDPHFSSVCYHFEHLQAHCQVCTFSGTPIEWLYVRAMAKD